MIRPATPEDLNYILETWLRRSRPWLTLARKLHFGIGKDLIALLLSRSQVLCDEREGRIAGWLCSERFEGHCVLHFVYVRKDERGKGIATALVEQARQGLPLVASRYVGPKCTKGIEGDSWLAAYLAMDSVRRIAESRL